MFLGNLRLSGLLDQSVPSDLPDQLSLQGEDSPLDSKLHYYISSRLTVCYSVTVCYISSRLTVKEDASVSREPSRDFYSGSILQMSPLTLGR